MSTFVSIFIFIVGVIGLVYMNFSIFRGVNRWRVAGHGRGFVAVLGWSTSLFTTWLAWNVLLAVCLLVNRGG